MREQLILGFLLTLAALFVVIGVAMWCPAVAFVVAGILVAGLAWLFFGDVE